MCSEFLPPEQTARKDDSQKTWIWLKFGQLLLATCHLSCLTPVELIDMKQATP